LYAVVPFEIQVLKVVFLSTNGMREEGDKIVIWNWASVSTKQEVVAYGLQPRWKTFVVICNRVRVYYIIPHVSHLDMGQLKRAALSELFDEVHPFAKLNIVGKQFW